MEKLGFYRRAGSLVRRFERACLLTTALVAVGVGEIMSTPAAAQNYIANPGFETNGGPGTQSAMFWTFAGQANGAEVGNIVGNAHSGTSYVRLSYNGNNNGGFNSGYGNISQTVNMLQPGPYTLSFYNGTFIGPQIIGYNVQVNGVTVGSISSTSQGGYSLLL